MRCPGGRTSYSILRRDNKRTVDTRVRDVELRSPVWVSELKLFDSVTATYQDISDHTQVLALDISLRVLPVKRFQGVTTERFEM